MGQKSKQRYFCFVKEDEEAFVSALRQKWPGIRFMRRNYWDYQDDSREIGNAVADWRNFPRNPELTDADCSTVRAWVEPEDWQPVWSKKRNDSGIFGVENTPTLQFTYDRSSGVFQTKDSEFKDNSPEGSPPSQNIGEGRIWAFYDEGDDAHRKFLDAALRIIAKLTTNKFDIYQEDGKPQPAAKGALTWIGYHALEWAARDPRRWIDGNLRPLGSPGINSPQLAYWKKIQPLLDAAENYDGPAKDHPVLTHPQMYVLGLDKKELK